MSSICGCSDAEVISTLSVNGAGRSPWAGARILGFFVRSPRSISPPRRSSTKRLPNREDCDQVRTPPLSLSLYFYLFLSLSISCAGNNGLRNVAYWLVNDELWTVEGPVALKRAFPACRSPQRPEPYAVECDAFSMRGCFSLWKER